jgi:hypothetical protein
MLLLEHIQNFYATKTLLKCNCGNILTKRSGRNTFQKYYARNPLLKYYCRNTLTKFCSRNTLHNFLNSLLFAPWKPTTNSTLHPLTALTHNKLSPQRSPGRRNVAPWTPKTKTPAQYPRSAANLSIHHTVSCCSPGIPRFPPVWHSTWQIRLQF